MPNDEMREFMNRSNPPFDPDAHMERLLEGVEDESSVELKVAAIAAVVTEIAQAYSEDAVMAAKNWAKVIQKSNATRENIKAVTSALLGHLHKN